MKYKNIAQKVIVFILLTCRLFFLISNFFKHNYLSQYAIKQKNNNVQSFRYKNSKYEKNVNLKIICEKD